MPIANWLLLEYENNLDTDLYTLFCGKPVIMIDDGFFFSSVKEKLWGAG